MGVESHVSCSLEVKSWLSVSLLNRQYMSRADFEFSPVARLWFEIDLWVPGGHLGSVHVHPRSRIASVALFVPTPTYRMDLGTSQQVGLP